MVYGQALLQRMKAPFGNLFKIQTPYIGKLIHFLTQWNLVTLAG